jgi:hypothetical protein
LPRKGNRFSDFARLKAACANQHPPDSSIGKTDFYPLKVWEKTPPGDARNFFTDPSSFFSQTTPGNGAADQGFFITNGAMLHRAQL